MNVLVLSSGTLNYLLGGSGFGDLKNTFQVDKESHAQWAKRVL